MSHLLEMPVLDDAIRTGQIADDPYAVYRQLQQPLCWSAQWNCWVLTQHKDVSAILKDTRRFSSAGRVVHAIRREFSEQDLQRVKPLVDHYSQGLIHSDPPDHTCVRRLVQGTFVPSILERLKPRIQKIVDDLLDLVQAKGRMDVIADLSFPLPITVIAELLGIPVTMRDQFKTWSGEITLFMATPRPTLEITLQSQQALLDLRDYFKTVFIQRRKQPGEDLISMLVQASYEGDKLTEEELLSTLVTILIGGHETTTSLIASSVWLIPPTRKLKRNCSMTRPSSHQRSKNSCDTNRPSSAFCALSLKTFNSMDKRSNKDKR